MCFVCSYRSTKPKSADADHLKASSSPSQALHPYIVRSPGQSGGGSRRSRKLYEEIAGNGQGLNDEGTLSYAPISLGLDASNPSRFRYPLTPPEVKFRIGVISDLDAESADPSDPGKWLSYLREGNLYIQQDKLDPSKTNISVEWDESAIHVIKSGLAYSGRGMELSTLNVFNGRLFSCDDRTGVIYELVRDGSLEIIPTPWAILADGNYTGGSFKCEWATVKDGDFYVGGNGRDLVTPEGKIIKNSKFVKRITAHGEVTHLDWAENFDKMATALNIHFPGFVVHEAAGWSDILDKWMFMPRYVSSEKFDINALRHSGSNVVLMADEHFDNVQVGHIGQVIPTHGFSGFKWIPGTNDQLVVALKSLEVENKQQTYIMAFDLRGNVLLPETKISDQKFEGIEFI
ncbi:Soluble calcium-activated nucleotidase 1 [Orchesella cincta]|uniref:Apyrase n=1 Tax=Orchesella cincta TaxID=48709 RepID=A0A1D2MDH7_ORCCI|nr:Soluble calcium-activated nucleotidase 1 [Orchesella cincta]